MAQKKLYSRRDDIESIIYTLAYMIKGKLPWDQDYFEIEEEKGQPEKGKDSEMDQILERKKVMDDKKIWENLPHDLQELFIYSRNLNYEQEPDYSFLTDSLLLLRNQALGKEGFKMNDLVLTKKISLSQNQLDNADADVPSIQ